MGTASGSESEGLPFARFLRRDCPARVSAMLDGLYQMAWPAIAAGLQNSLAQLDDDLFRHAERAPNVNEQNLSFEGLRELRRGRADFLAACRDGVQRSLLHLIDSQVPQDQLRAIESVVGRRTPLSLVDPVHLEQVLVLIEVATRAEMRSGDELQALSYRLAAIVGSAPLEHDELALGPHAVCASVRAASACFEFTPAHRMALYRRIDKSLFADSIGLYESINHHLVGQGVLAWLQLVPRRVVPRSASGVRAAPPGVPASGAPGSVVPADAQASNAAPAASAPAVASAPSSAVPSPPPAAPAALEGPAMQALRRHLGGGQQERQTPAPAAEAVRRAGADAAPADRHAAAGGGESLDQLSFDTLRELLAGRRSGPEADAIGGGGERPLASEADVDAALSALQARGSGAPTLVGGRPIHRRVADVKREILAQLRGRSDGAPARLRAQDSDAIDLVGFLFDHLLAEQRPTGIAHDLLTQLQVPLIKVALKDKGFFTQRDHPARQLLNALVETGAVWLDDEHQDTAVVDKMRWVVDRVGQDFDGDSTVFGSLFEDLSRHMGGLKKRAEVAERHYVEAARGREKLDLARASATAHVRQRLERAEPPAAARTLLESAWADAIALSLLRQGHDHPQTRERLEFVDRMIDLFGYGRPLAERRFELQKLRELFEDGLRSVGHHDDTVHRTWSDIARLVEEFGDATASVAAQTVRQLVAQQPRLGGVRKDAEAPAAASAGEHGKAPMQAPRKDAALPLSPREVEMVEHIKHLPFGTWFEFTLNQQGDKARRKLCWFSPVTGHCLFVNVRGAKAQERSIDNLARDLVRGNVRLVEEVRENLIDRAWKSIVAMLRGGRPASSDVRPEAT